MSETHTTHPRFTDLSWARSGALAKPRTGYIVASLAWVRVPFWAVVSKKSRSNPNPNPNPNTGQEVEAGRAAEEETREDGTPAQS